MGKKQYLGRYYQRMEIGTIGYLKLRLTHKKITKSRDRYTKISFCFCDKLFLKMKNENGLIKLNFLKTILQ